MKTNYHRRVFFSFDSGNWMLCSLNNLCSIFYLNLLCLNGFLVDALGYLGQCATLLGDEDDLVSAMAAGAVVERIAGVGALDPQGVAR